jgi:trehalose/maltose hydrolase-like predicted phosphorylase
MARWNLLRALDAAALFQARWPQHWTALATRLGLGEAALAAWNEVAKSVATGLNEETGLYEQFAGFFELERVDLDRHRDRAEPMNLVLGEERTQRSQVIKQADVVSYRPCCRSCSTDGAGLRTSTSTSPGAPTAVR